jgi:hypothetical protein
MRIFPSAGQNPGPKKSGLVSNARPPDKKLRLAFGYVLEDSPGSLEGTSQPASLSCNITRRRSSWYARQLRTKWVGL